MENWAQDIFYYSISKDARANGLFFTLVTSITTVVEVLTKVMFLTFLRDCYGIVFRLEKLYALEYYFFQLPAK
jgi:hypothetical protein